MSVIYSVYFACHALITGTVFWLVACVSDVRKCPVIKSLRSRIAFSYYFCHNCYMSATHQARGGELVIATLALNTSQLAKIRRWTKLQTDSALAEAMGTDRGNLSRVLSGRQQPGPQFVGSLCKALDADLADLFEIVPQGEVAA